jgi:hypothetical protein
LIWLKLYLRTLFQNEGPWWRMQLFHQIHINFSIDKPTVFSVLQ